MDLFSNYRADQKAHTAIEHAHDPEPLLMSDIPVDLIDGVRPVESLGVGKVDSMLGEVLPTLGFISRHHLM
jgi:hypothetical protein